MTHFMPAVATIAIALGIAGLLPARAKAAVYVCNENDVAIWFALTMPDRNCPSVSPFTFEGMRSVSWFFIAAHQCGVVSDRSAANRDIYGYAVAADSSREWPAMGSTEYVFSEAIAGWSQCRWNDTECDTRACFRKPHRYVRTPSTTAVIIFDPWQN